MIPGWGIGGCNRKQADLERTERRSNPGEAWDELWMIPIVLRAKQVKRSSCSYNGAPVFHDVNSMRLSCAFYVPIIDWLDRMGLYANVLLETLQYCFVLSIIWLFTFLGAENSTLMANEHSERFNRKLFRQPFYTERPRVTAADLRLINYCQLPLQLPYK